MTDEPNPPVPRRRYPLGDYGLAILLGALFLGSWIGQFIIEIIVVRNETEAADEKFTWSDFWPEFWQSTLENWQSEFLQLLTFVVLTTYVIYRGSHESRDNDDEVVQQLNRIESRLATIEAQTATVREP